VRSAGIKVADVDELVAKLKESAGSSLHEDVLVWVEHDNASLKDATLAAVTAGHRSWAKCTSSWSPAAGSRRCRGEAAKIAGVAKVHLADDAAYANALAENVAPLIVS
jgi:electron transfer flavoprotein alpha subunit